MKSNKIKEVNFSGEEFLRIGKIAKLFFEIGISEEHPKFVIYLGGVGSGKTTTRRQQHSTGFVHFDFGEIYNAIKKEVGENDPKLFSYTALASDIILRESIESKKNIVIEIIGDNNEIIDPVINKVVSIGYKVSVQFISCDPIEAYKRHLRAVEEDKDYLSAYFTQEATLSMFYQQLELGDMVVSPNPSIAE